MEIRFGAFCILPRRQLSVYNARSVEHEAQTVRCRLNHMECLKESVSLYHSFTHWRNVWNFESCYHSFKAIVLRIRHHLKAV
jgi:hypothetical protein